MPKMDGFTFITRLHENEAWRDIPIVVLTAGDLDKEDRDRLQGSVRDILLKGAYSQDQLLEEVRSMLTDYTMNDNLAAQAIPGEE